MNLAGIKVLELGGSGLGDFHVGYEGENNVGRVSLLYMGLDSEGICGVDKDTGVLGSDDGLNNGCQIVDIRKGLDAENYIVIGAFA